MCALVVQQPALFEVAPHQTQNEKKLIDREFINAQIVPRVFHEALLYGCAGACRSSSALRDGRIASVRKEVQTV